MTDGKVPRIAALVREALAVLAAILVAFALDAWWDARVEEGNMLEALDAVAIEVERNLTEVDSARSYNEERGVLVADLAALTPGDVTALSDDELARFADLPNYQLVTLELGATTAFVEGGYLSVLDDRALRAEVAGLPRLQGELDEEASVVTTASERLNASVMDAVPLELMVMPGGVASPEATRSMMLAMTGDEDMLRALAARTFFLTYLYGSELDRVAARLQQVRDGIEAYREGR